MAEYDPKEYKIEKYDKAKWEEYERIELAWFAQNARDDHTTICRRLGFMTLQDSTHILTKIEELYTEAARAQSVLKDWDRLKEHMKENPTIKEGWDGLMMAIRLTEED